VKNILLHQFTGNSRFENFSRHLKNKNNILLKLIKLAVQTVNQRYIAEAKNFMQKKVSCYNITDMSYAQTVMAVKSVAAKKVT
jgi:hypothetical protein